MTLLRSALRTGCGHSPAAPSGKLSPRHSLLALGGSAGQEVEAGQDPLKGKGSHLQERPDPLPWPGGRDA